VAGAGYKTWTRERLSISDLQGYLQDQVVLHYPSSAARDTALPSSLRFVGMRVLILDTLTEQVWTGGGWVRVAGRRTVGRTAIGSGVSTDASGIVIQPHGLGAVPSSISITTGPQGSDLLNRIGVVKLLNYDSANLVVLFVRTDTSAVIGSSVIGYEWSAEL